jgi:hypothetical protein
MRTRSKSCGKRGKGCRGLYTEDEKKRSERKTYVFSPRLRTNYSVDSFGCEMNNVTYILL